MDFDINLVSQSHVVSMNAVPLTGNLNIHLYNKLACTYKMRWVLLFSHRSMSTHPFHNVCSNSVLQWQSPYVNYVSLASWVNMRFYI